jgi:tetrapyrrole methylase family protein/MazG family protein
VDATLAHDSTADKTRYLDIAWTMTYTRRMIEEEKRRFPKSMPALERAQKVTEWAATLGFDWPEIEPVWKKVEEETEELRSAATMGDRNRIAEELGDLLFSLVNLSRFLRVDAEAALGEAVERFFRRFAYVEKKINEQGRKISDASLDEMDAFWEEAKRLEGGK